MKSWVLFLSILGIILFSLYLVTMLRPSIIATEEDKAIAICKDACISAREAKDLSAGPCLLNPMPELPNWVCDVAHWPREDIDNLAENQCSAYREGRAKHFVEVDTNCKLIRAI